MSESSPLRRLIRSASSKLDRAPSGRRPAVGPAQVDRHGVASPAPQADTERCRRMFFAAIMSPDRLGAGRMASSSVSGPGRQVDAHHVSRRLGEQVIAQRPGARRLPGGRQAALGLSEVAGELSGGTRPSRRPRWRGPAAGSGPGQATSRAAITMLSAERTSRVLGVVQEVLPGAADLAMGARRRRPRPWPDSARRSGSGASSRWVARLPQPSGPLANQAARRRRTRRCHRSRRPLRQRLGRRTLDRRRSSDCSGVEQRIGPVDGRPQRLLPRQGGAAPAVSRRSTGRRRPAQPVQPPTRPTRTGSETAAARPATPLAVEHLGGHLQAQPGLVRGLAVATGPQARVPGALGDERRELGREVVPQRRVAERANGGNSAWNQVRDLLEDGAPGRSSAVDEPERLKMPPGSPSGQRAVPYHADAADTSRPIT